MLLLRRGWALPFIGFTVWVLIRPPGFAYSTPDFPEAGITFTWSGCTREVQRLIVETRFFDHMPQESESFLEWGRRLDEIGPPVDFNQQGQEFFQGPAGWYRNAIINTPTISHYFDVVHDRIAQHLMWAPVDEESLDFWSGGEQMANCVIAGILDGLVMPVNYAIGILWSHVEHAWSAETILGMIWRAAISIFLYIPFACAVGGVWFFINIPITLVQFCMMAHYTVTMTNNASYVAGAATVLLSGLSLLLILARDASRQ